MYTLLCTAADTASHQRYYIHYMNIIRDARSTKHKIHQQVLGAHTVYGRLQYVEK
jgi:hypothetical protein